MQKKSRSFNFLIELLIVIVFFTISSIVCVNIFYQADLRSKKANNITDASLEMENIIESLKKDDDILDDGKMVDGKIIFDHGNYKIDIEQIAEIESHKGRYLVYELIAYDNNGERLLDINTTCMAGDK